MYIQNGVGERLSLQKAATTFLLIFFTLQTFSSPAQAANSPASRAFALSESLDVDPSSGTAAVTIPIEVAQGRGGIQPSVNLLYNSSSGNGFLGVGWTLEMGSISRSTRKGTPKFNNTDTFVLTQAGSTQELVDISGNATEFRPENEGAFMKIQFNGTAWTLTDKKGTKYYFGTTVASRVVDADTGTKIFKWCLDRVEDLNGNYMTVQYWGEDFQKYPLEIQYTGNSLLSLAPFASVKFEYESKTASADSSASYLSGSLIKQTQRLKTVKAIVGTDVIRKYTLTYIADPITGKSLLKNATLTGKDGVSTLPATIMTYSQPTYSFDPAVNLTNLPDSLGNAKIRMMDMNNDGLSDLVDTSVSGSWKMYPNQSVNGTVSYGSAVTLVNSPTFMAANTGTRLVDLNADGLIDAVQADAMNTPYKIWINNGVNGFEVMKTATNFPTMWLYGNEVQFIDMNSDGLPDIVQSFAAENQAYKIFLNNGSGDFAPAVTAQNSPMYYFGNLNIRLADINGDTQIDVIYGNGSSCLVWLNNGVNGFQTSKSVVKYPAGFAFSDARIQVVDMNGDGLADLLFGQAPYQLYLNNGKTEFNSPVTMALSPSFSLNDPNIRLVDYNADNLPDVMGGSNPYWVQLNNGNGGFMTTLTMANTPNFPLSDANTVLHDFNGDGILDVINGTSGTYKFWTKSATARLAKANSLLDVDNSLGGHLELQYQNLPIKGWGGPQYGNTFGRTLLNTVKTIGRRATLNGELFVTQYVYLNGLWDAKNREFRGFKTVKMVDPDGNYSLTEYSQDDVFKGRSLFQASYDSQNRLFSKSENTWDKQTLYTGVTFAFLKQADNYIYDGDASGRRTQAQFFYEESPQYGNLTKSINYGEVNLTTGADLGTDKTTTEVTYHNNTAKWLLGLPKVTTIKDNSNVQFAKTTFYYDSNASVDTLPTLGYLTKKINWAGDAPGTTHPFTTYTYDSIGNLLTTADSNNSATSIVYDTTYKMFPLETTNALGHKVTNEYYGINGVALSGADGTFGLWGQLKSTTDPNNQKGLRIYDVFGRTVKMVSPLDTVSLPTTSFEYIYGVSQLKVISHQRIKPGSSGMIDSVVFYDGLGRAVQSKTRSEIEGQNIVSGQSEYNSRGLPVKKYVSYSTEVSLTELNEPDLSQNYTLVTYDAMGRVLRTTSLDGTYANVVYDDWTSTSYDENGHMQKSYFDAAGRLIKKEEYLGADGRHPLYPASAFTLYATTLYSYDPKGNLIQTQDAKGNITTITYDTLGRKIAMNDPDMGSWSYGYDVEGNLIWQEDAKGQRLNFTYDQINRLKQKTDQSVLTVNYTYDDPLVTNSKGRLTKAAYGGGNTSFAYDQLGRELNSIKAIGSGNFQVGRTYDALDRLVTLQYPDSSKVGYTYNAAGLVNSVFEVLAGTQMPDPTGSDQLYMISPSSQYRFNENALNTTVTDYGTNHTNVTASVNTSSLTTTGKISSAFKLNGTNQYINFDALLPKVRYDNTGSFSFWIKPEAGSSVLNFAGAGGYLSMEWSALSEYVAFTISGTGTQIACATPEHSVPFGNWTHVAIVQDGVSLKIYLNGIEQPLYYWTQSQKGAWFNNNWAGPITNGRLGAWNASSNPAANSAFFKGSVDDLRYYSNKALIPQEVWGLYKNGTGTEAENPGVSNDIPPAAQVIPYMASAFSQFKLNDNAGNTTVYDEGASYNDGVATTNTSTLSVAGKVGRALSFNGTSQYVNLDNLFTDIRNDTVGSFSFWVKPVLGEDIMNFTGPDGKNFYVIWSKAYQSLVFAIYGNSTPVSCLTPNGSLPTNVWTHVTITQDGTGFKIYINGNEQALTYMDNGNKGAWLSTLTGTTRFSRLGAIRYGYSDYYFQGSVDDLRYYKKALNSTEAQALYNSGMGTEDANPPLASAPAPLPPLEGSSVPPSAGEVYIQDVDYNALGQMTSVEFGNGVVTTYTYSAQTLRLSKIKTVKGATVLQEFNYSYDGVGNITAIEDLVNTGSQTFQYDALNRLTQAVGVSYGTKNYVYDQIGNVIQKDGLTYTYSKVNAGPHAVTSLSDGTTINYDANGNMASKSKSGEVFTYTYDKENRLVEVRKNMTLLAQYLYDGDGGRVQKVSYVSTVQEPAGGVAFGPLNTNVTILTTPVTTQYVGELYEETSGVGSKFIFLGGQRIAALDTNAAAPIFYHGDHLGSTNVMTDENGSQLELIEYEPYGKIQRHDGAAGNNRLAKQQFTGKKLDDETGLVYFGARYYDPSLGRFITPDTIVQSPNNPQTLSRYSYCSNNPINYVDPSGHSWFKKAIGKILGGIAAAVTFIGTGGNIGLAANAYNSVESFITPAANGNWGVAAQNGFNSLAMGSGNPFFMASGFSGMLSYRAGEQGYNDLSRTLGYTSQAFSAAYVAWDVGVGIRDWAVGKGAFYDVATGNQLSAQDISTQYGGGGASIFTNGMMQNQAESLLMAQSEGANVLFYNPTHGAIADFTESFLGKITFTDSLSRQLAGVGQGLKNAAYTGYSQGTIITSNALLAMAHRGGRGVASGSSFTALAPAISQARFHFSVYEAGIRTFNYNSKLFDVANILGPNLSPIHAASGTIGATTTYGLKVHGSY